MRKIIKKVGAGYEVPEKGDKVTGLFWLRVMRKVTSSRFPPFAAMILVLLNGLK